MENIHENNQDQTSGQLKVNEYISRIKAGESKDSIFEGLPSSFREAIEKGLNEKTKEIPPELHLGISNDQIDQRRNEDQRRINELEIELGIQHKLSNEEKLQRKKLTGWNASYELARLAQEENVDLSTLSREDYAQYAIDHYLAIDDDQLRMAPWQRNETSVAAIVEKRKQKKASLTDADSAFNTFSNQMKQLAEKPQQERWLDTNIRILSGTKNTQSWLHFGINNTESADRNITHKSYFSFKDLHSMTPERLLSFMKELRDAGYQGQLKTFQDLMERGTALNDQVVMHGNTEADAQLALSIAERFFGNEIASKSIGADRNVDGSNLSYSQVLAKHIKDSIDSKK